MFELLTRLESKTNTESHVFLEILVGDRERIAFALIFFKRPAAPYFYFGILNGDLYHTLARKDKATSSLDEIIRLVRASLVQLRDQELTRTHLVI